MTQREIQLARWYESFLDVCKLLKSRGSYFHIAVHPSNEKEFDDYRARVIEDEIWNKVLRGEPPRIIPIASMTKDEYRPVDIRQLMPQALNEIVHSDKGYGRFKKLYTPRMGESKLDR